MKFNDLHYLPMSLIIFPLEFIFPLGFILPPYHFAPPPPSPRKLLNYFTLFIHFHVSFFPLDSFCPHIILPPGNRLMINTIYPCPISFSPLDSFCRRRHFAPPPPPPLGEKLFNDSHYLPMSHIILSPGLDPWGWDVVL